MAARKKTPTAYAHIWLDEEARPWIDDTNIKVIEVVMEKIGWAWSPEAIQLQHPHLSLAQIHAAFTYYYDHQAEIDEEIKRGLEEHDAVLAQRSESPTLAKARALGLRS